MKVFPTRKVPIAYPLVLSFILATVGSLLSIHMDEFKNLVPLFMFWIFISLFHPRPQITFVASIFSYGISCSIYGIASFMITFSSYALSNATFKPTYDFLALFSSLLQTILIWIIFKSKRLNNGIHFLLSASCINIATILSLIFISLTTYFKKYHLLGLLSVFFTFAFLIYWWQAQITKAYRRRLELRELESLRTEVSELNIKITKLTEENEKQIGRASCRERVL